MGVKIAPDGDNFDGDAVVQCSDLFKALVLVLAQFHV